MKLKYFYIGLLIYTACSSDPKNPGYEYMPDMAHSRAYESFSANSNFSDGKTMREPIKGSISRDRIMYQFPNTKEGYEAAGNILKNPLPINPSTIEEGKQLYQLYCHYCHGESGNADGIVVIKGKFPPPPAFTSENLQHLPEGKIFHSITYGKNLMGSHAAQLNTEDRWKVVLYIQQLQQNNQKK